MMSTLLLAIAIVTLCISSSFTTAVKPKRPKRMAFNFPNNENLNDNLATVPTVDPPIPTDFSFWNKPAAPMLEPAADYPAIISDRTNNDTLMNTTRKPEKNYRDDCPFFKNLCNDDNSCKEDQECNMDLECTDLVCVDKIAPMFAGGIGDISDSSSDAGNNTHMTTKPSKNYRDDCPFTKNFCSRVNPCDKDQEICNMNLDCTAYVCVDKNKPDDSPIGDSSGAVVSNLGKEPSTPKPDKSNGFPLLCVHGKWADQGCACDPGWTERLCNMPCKLDCVHGNCIIDRKGALYLKPEEVTQDEHMICNCKPGYQGSYCEEKKPDLVGEAEQRTIKLTVSLSAVLFVVIVTSSLVLVMLWRKRVIVVMKLVYFFKLEEDNDGRFYDAYISMGTSKRGLDFVKDQLCPMLENYGFRLYVQARDQLIGEALTESIHKAMEQSRRTILIVTPEYLQNEWSKFECIVAQIETLKLQQRIIPIVLEDISDDKQNMNKTLKHILESVRCLKFPKVKENPKHSPKAIEALKQKKEQKFWKRLELTMPKKKNSVSETWSEMSDMDSKTVKPINITFTDMYSVV